MVTHPHPNKMFFLRLQILACVFYKADCGSNAIIPLPDWDLWQQSLAYPQAGWSGRDVVRI